jgi:hypothetical protein
LWTLLKLFLPSPVLSHLQDLKWRADERIQVLNAEVERLTTAKNQAEAEGRVQVRGEHSVSVLHV